MNYFICCFTFQEFERFSGWYQGKWDSFRKWMWSILVRFRYVFVHFPFYNSCAFISTFLCSNRKIQSIYDKKPSSTHHPTRFPLHTTWEDKSQSSPRWKREKMKYLIIIYRHTTQIYTHSDCILCTGENLFSFPSMFINLCGVRCCCAIIHNHVYGVCIYGRNIPFS